MDVYQIGIIFLGLCLSFAAGAETEWLVPQPVTLQPPASVKAPRQDCHYQQQLTLARQGKAENQYQVALCYYYGLGVDVDPEKALYWLRQAAAQNHKAAMYQLAEFHHRHDKYYNPALAMQWYKKSAKAEYIPAQVRMAEMYVQGEGVPQDYVEAYKWFYMAGMFSANGGPRLRGSIRDQRQALAKKMKPEQITRAREAISVLLKQTEQ